MRKTIYHAIRQALERMEDESGHAVLSHIDLWNQQVSNSEEEQPFGTPAVFVEFSPIQWAYLAHGVREATVQITLHVVTDSRVGRWQDAISALDLCDNIHRTLFGLTYKDNVHTMNTLMHVQSITDHDFGELQDNQEIYTCLVCDASAYPYTSMSGKDVALDVGVEAQNAGR